MFGELTPLIYMFTPPSVVLLMLLVVTRDGYSKAGWAVGGRGRTHGSAAGALGPV
jgi:hypothetical protein